MISPMIDDIGAITGAATLSGNAPRATWIRSATTWRATSGSVSQSNSAHTTEIPIPDELRRRRSPDTPLRLVSMGRVTRVSTSSGAMPCASVITVTVGALMSGRTSTGIRVARIVPYTSTNAPTARAATRLRRDQRISASPMVAPQ